MAAVRRAHGSSGTTIPRVHEPLLIVHSALVRRYYARLTMDFQTNKRVCEEVAIIPSKALKNKIAGYTTHLMKRIQRGPVRGISLKLQEEERERRMDFVPDVSAVDTDVIEVRTSPVVASLALASERHAADGAHPRCWEWGGLRQFGGGSLVRAACRDLRVLGPPLSQASSRRGSVYSGSRARGGVVTRRPCVGPPILPDMWTMVAPSLCRWIRRPRRCCGRSRWLSFRALWCSRLRRAAGRATIRAAAAKGSLGWARTSQQPPPSQVARCGGAAAGAVAFPQLVARLRPAPCTNRVVRGMIVRGVRRPYVRRGGGQRRARALSCMCVHARVGLDTAPLNSRSRIHAGPCSHGLPRCALVRAVSVSATSPQKPVWRVVLGSWLRNTKRRAPGPACIERNVQL